MPANESRHSCAVCTRLINTRLLMCLPHWKLVPAAQQQAVYDTRRRWWRSSPRNPYSLQLRREYFAARDAAIASAQAALPATPTGEPT